MSPKDNKEINMAKLRAMFEQFGYTRGEFTEMDNKGNITGHCLMGALGHAYDIGNDPMFNITMGHINEIADSGRRAAIQQDVIDIASVAYQRSRQRSNLTSKHPVGVAFIEVNVHEAAGRIMSYNDSVAGSQWAIPIHHTHDHYWRRATNGYKGGKNQVVWLGARTKKASRDEHEWEMYKAKKESNKHAGHFDPIRYNTDECTLDCATWVTDNDLALQDIYSLLDEVEVLQQERVHVPVQVEA